MNKPMFKTISFLVGGILILVTGLLFVLITDLYMSNTSGWLFFSIIFSFGGGGLFLLSDNFKHKRSLFLILKSAGILISIGFIIYMFVFKNSDVFLAKITLKLLKNSQGFALTAEIGGFYMSWIILTILSVVAQGFNLLLHALYKEE